MAIVFPAFEDTLCLMAGVCAHVRYDVSITSLPSDDIEIVASYRARPGRAMTRLVWNPAKRHLHVDVALVASFGKQPPKPNITMGKFRKIIALFEGLTVVARPHGYYLIPQDRLPATGGLIFTGKSSIRLSSGDTKIELTGATLTFDQSEVSRIRWELLRDSVMLDIDAEEVDSLVQNSYLTRALKDLDSAVAIYILGEKTNAKPNV